MVNHTGVNIAATGRQEVFISAANFGHLNDCTSLVNFQRQKEMSIRPCSNCIKFFIVYLLCRVGIYNKGKGGNEY